MKVKLEIEIDGAMELAALAKGLALLMLRLSEPEHREHEGLKPAALRLHAKVGRATILMLSAKAGGFVQ